MPPAVADGLIKLHVFTRPLPPAVTTQQRIAMAKDFFGRDQKGARNEDPEIRVTDRRRIQLDDDAETDNSARVEAPSLKPSYVEELEARTKAAEQKVQEVQSRFEQLRKQTVSHGKF